MCRWMAWSGQPLLIEELLFKPAHGLVDQSLHSRMGVETDQRRRVRPRLVRSRRGARRLPQRRAGVGRREPARARGARGVAAVHRARARDHGHRDPADELPPVPARPVAVRPQRLDRGLRRDAARPHARDRPGAVPDDRGLDRLGGAVQPGADASAWTRTRSPRSSARSASSRTTAESHGVGTRCRPASGSATASACGRSAIRPRGNRARSSARRRRVGPRSCTRRTSGSSGCATRTGWWSPSRWPTCPASWESIPESTVLIVQPGEDEQRPFRPAPR